MVRLDESCLTLFAGYFLYNDHSQLRGFKNGTSTSPVMTGYTRISEYTAYTSQLGYGWTSDTYFNESRDRGAPDDLKRDFVSGPDQTFRCNLPNGNYSVTVTQGDTGYNSSNNKWVKANGTTVISNVNTAPGQFAVNQFNVTVSGGYLSLELSSDTGIFIVNGIEISTNSSATPTPALTTTPSPTPTATLAPTPSPMPTSTPLLGDVTGDGKILSSDALKVLQAVSGKTVLTPDQEIAADVTRNGLVQSSDALKILQYCSGKITVL